MAKKIEEWLTNANGFEILWNLPNCDSPVDEKHITLQALIFSECQYYN